MIKNYLRVGVLALCACGGADPARGAYQGVVELDERLLSFEVPGRIQRLTVARGDVVKVDQVVAALDDTLGRAAREARARDADAVRAQVALARAGSRAEEVKGAAAEARSARANEAVLRDQLQRQRALFKENAVAQATVDELENRLASAVALREASEQRLAALSRGTRPEQISISEAQLAAAEQAVALEDERLRRYELHAPLAGSILDISMWPGEIAGAGATVLTVADVDHPYADVFVPQAELGGVAVGVRASLRVDGGAAPLSGHVEHVSPTTEFTPRYVFSERERPNIVVRVRVRIDDPEHHLHAGVPAFVTLEKTAEAKR
jgi:HlyD family secretion protein